MLTLINSSGWSRCSLAGSVWPMLGLCSYLWPQDGLKRVTDATSPARRPRLLPASAVTDHYGWIFSWELLLNVYCYVQSQFLFTESVVSLLTFWRPSQYDSDVLLMWAVSNEWDMWPEALVTRGDPGPVAGYHRVLYSPHCAQLLSRCSHPRPARPIRDTPLERSANHSPVTILRPWLSTNQRPGSRLSCARPHLVPASGRLVPVTPMSASMGLSQPIRELSWGLVTNERPANSSSGLGARGLTPPK